MGTRLHTGAVEGGMLLDDYLTAVPSANADEKTADPKVDFAATLQGLIASANQRRRHPMPEPKQWLTLFRMKSVRATPALTKHYQYPAHLTDHLFEPGSLSFPALLQNPRPTSLAAAPETRNLSELIN